MRRKISLYIGDQLADLDDQSIILLNYTMENLSNPTVVRNSYSRQVTLPGTAANNVIFGGSWRPDRVPGSGGTGGDFNPAVKTPFTVYDEMNEVLESGYVRLDGVTRKPGGVSYQVTLFGGLAAFLHELSYNADGSRKTLADLTLLPPTVDQNTGLTLGYYVDARGRVLPSATACFGCMVAVAPGDVVKIRNNGYLWMITAYYNGAVVQSAGTSGLRSWTVPAGVNGCIITYRQSEPDKTLLITRAGSPEELGFVIDRTAVSDAWARLGGSQTVFNLWDILNFAPAYNGLPGGLFDADKAIFSPAAAGVPIPEGYSSRGGAVALASFPKAYTEWETQDLRSYLQRPVIKVSRIIEAICQSYNNGGYSVELDAGFFNSSNPYWDKTWLTLPLLNTLDVRITEGTGSLTVSGDTLTVPDGGNPSTEYKVTVALRPTLTVSGQGSTTEYDLHCDDTYVQDGVTLTGHYMNYITFTGKAYDSNGNVIQERVVRASSRQTAGQGGVPQIDFIGYFDYNGDWVGDPVVLSFDAIGIARVAVTRTVTAAGWGSLRFNLNPSLVWEDTTSYTPNYTVSAYGQTYPSGENVYDYTTSDAARSGVAITKRMLLSSDKTPADYLLSYCKTFGLVFLFDKGERKVSILQRKTFYRDNVIDLTGRIDTGKGVGTVPFAFDSKWYDFSLPYENGEFAKYYANIYDRVFGLQRVNTGYEFNTEAKDLLAGIAFRGACQVLESSKYYATISNGTLRVPAVFQDSGATFTVTDRAGESTDFPIPLPSPSSYRRWWNPDDKTFDFLSKPQFHDAGNAAYEERDTLLFLNGMADISLITDRLALSDDTAVMMALNDNTPCWILDPSVVGGYTALTSLPYFSRYVRENGVVTRSLDFGTPAEVALPGVTFADGSSVYEAFWRRYIGDRYDDESRVMTCRVNLSGFQVNASLLRDFYYFDGALWALNKITNHSLTTWDDTECEFVKVQDMNNYRQ